MPRLNPSSWKIASGCRKPKAQRGSLCERSPKQKSKEGRETRSNSVYFKSCFLSFNVWWKVYFYFLSITFIYYNSWFNDLWKDSRIIWLIYTGSWVKSHSSLVWTIAGKNVGTYWLNLNVRSCNTRNLSDPISYSLSELLSYEAINGVKIEF